MRASQRQQQILSSLQQQDVVRVSALAEALGVSQNTVRNDLDALAADGLVIRTHGGATIPRQVLPAPLRPKSLVIGPGGDHVARYAASRIEDGDSLILDDSALCVRLAEQMAHLSNLRVITSSFAIAYVLAQEPTNRVVIAGGEFDPSTLSARGSMVRSAINGFRANKAFFSCTGVSPHRGLTEMSTEAAQIKQTMKESADSAFVVVESDRVGRIDLFPVGGLEEPRRIVTDSGIHESDVRALVERGARVTVCSADGHVTYRPYPSGQQALTIGFANLSHNVWFAQRVREGLERAARQERHVDLHVKDNCGSRQEAIRNVEEFLAQNVDLMIEYSGGGAVVGRTVMRMMHLADVHVVAVDLPFIGATYFGCNHDAVGTTAGDSLARWVQDHWGGQVDDVMLITFGRGQDGGNSNDNTGTRDETEVTLSPEVRLDAALDAFQALVPCTPHVRRWGTPVSLIHSEETVSLAGKHFARTIESIPKDHRVAAVCVVNELALGLAQAVRRARREDHFAIVSFGTPGAAVRAELADPRTCMIGLVDLHPERYGEKLLDVCLRILAGSAVPPAVFVEHKFLSSAEIQITSVP